MSAFFFYPQIGPIFAPRPMGGNQRHLGSWIILCLVCFFVANRATKTHKKPIAVERRPNGTGA